MFIKDIDQIYDYRAENLINAPNWVTDPHFYSGYGIGCKRMPFQTDTLHFRAYLIVADDCTGGHNLVGVDVEPEYPYGEFAISCSTLFDLVRAKYGEPSAMSPADARRFLVYHDTTDLVLVDTWRDAEHNNAVFYKEYYRLPTDRPPCIIGYRPLTVR
jgi:hypothetical protein